MGKWYQYFLGVSLCIVIFGIGMKILTSHETLQSASIEIAKGEEVSKVALTFDDGPHAVYTPQLLDGLKERNVKASFFLIGKLVEENPDIVKRMQEEGHLIGNHTYDHVQLDLLSDEEACAQVTKAGNAIFEATGMYTAYLRPPFGAWKKDLDCIVTMLPVLWNVDSLDWTTSNADRVVSKVVNNVQDGDIILMHDEYASSLEAAFRIIDILQEQGYEFVTVDQFLLE